MSTFGDYDTEMSRLCPLDDAVVEALLAGGAAPGDFGGVADFLEAVGHLAFEPAPVPSMALAGVLAEGLRRDEPSMPNQHFGRARRATAVDGVESTMWRRRRTARVVTAKAAGLSLVAKVALGISAAAASTAGAAAGMLPAPAQTFVSRAVETVTPFNIPNPAAPPRTEHPSPAVLGTLTSTTTTSQPSPTTTEPPAQEPASPVVSPTPPPTVAPAPPAQTAPVPVPPPAQTAPPGPPPTTVPVEPPPEEPPTTTTPPEEPPTTTTPDDPDTGDQTDVDADPGPTDQADPPPDDPGTSDQPEPPPDDPGTSDQPEPPPAAPGTDDQTEPPPDDPGADDQTAPDNAAEAEEAVVAR